LWRSSQGGPIGEADILDAVRGATGAALARELEQWVHGTRDLPLSRLLAAAGVTLHDEAAGFAAGFGLRLSEGPLSGVQVKSVAADSAAARAGVSAGDEVLAIDGWRVRRLDEALQWSTPDRPLELLVSRDRKLHTLTLKPEARSPLRRQHRLALSEQVPREVLARRRAWLGA
jgi:predicted metalloprotease with PDZ domain